VDVPVAGAHREGARQQQQLAANGGVKLGGARSEGAQEQHDRDRHDQRDMRGAHGRGVLSRDRLAQLHFTSNTRREVLEGSSQRASARLAEQQRGGDVIPDRVGQATSGALERKRQVVVATQVLGQAAQRRLERQWAAGGQNAEDLLEPLARLELVARPFEQRRQLLGARGAKLVAFAPDIDEG
jgi:hypothetical protein